MPRAIWSGAISLGLVNVPLRMYSAIDEQDIHFHLLHERDDSRIGYEKVCKAEGKPVPDDEIVKAYEVKDGEYVYVTDEDLKAAEGENLIDRFTGPFKPEKYEDTYRKRLLDVINAKRKGKEVHVERRAEEEPADLMEALRASLESARRRGGRSQARRRHSSDGELAGLSKAELEKRAKRAGITGYSKMKKEELVEALEAA